MVLSSLIIPLGITTFVSMVVTAILGQKIKFIQPKLKFRLHRIFGVITIITATTHAAIVIYLNVLI